MNVSSPIFNKRYFSLGVVVYIVATYLGLKFDTCLGKGNLNVFVYSLCYTVILTVISGIAYFIFHKNTKITSQILSIYLIVIIFIIGYSRVCCVYSSYTKNNTMIANNPKIYGIVTSEPKLSSSGKSYAINTDVLQLNTSDDIITLDNPIRTITYISKDSIDSPPSVGDTFKCTYDFELNMKPTFKGGFDYSRYIKQNKVCYSGYTYDYTKFDGIKYTPSPFRKLCSLGYKLRSAITDSFNIYTYSDNEKALLGGILLGDVSSFSDDLYDAYTDSGLIHIASVSGMHTSYLFLIISIILTLMHIPRRIYAIFAIPVLIIFAAIALFTPSVNRSVIMLSILLLSSIFKRENDSITALSFSAVVILFNNPYSLESYSFILSFSATLGLLIYATPIKRNISSAVLSFKNKYSNKPLSNLSLYIINSISLSLSGMIGISYFTANFFGRITHGGIIGNIIIFPAVAVIFIFGFLNSLIFYVYKPLSRLIAVYILNPTLKLTNDIAAFFSNDIFSFSTPHSYKIFFIIYIVICYIIYILLTSNKKGESSEAAPKS